MPDASHSGRSTSIPLVPAPPVETLLALLEPEQDAELSIGHHMLAGSVAGVVEHTFMYPLDTYKVSGVGANCSCNHIPFIVLSTPSVFVSFPLSCLRRHSYRRHGCRNRPPFFLCSAPMAFFACGAASARSFFPVHPRMLHTLRPTKRPSVRWVQMRVVTGHWQLQPRVCLPLFYTMPWPHRLTSSSSDCNLDITVVWLTACELWHERKARVPSFARTRRRCS